MSSQRRGGGLQPASECGGALRGEEESEVWQSQGCSICVVPTSCRDTSSVWGHPTWVAQSPRQRQCVKCGFSNQLPFFFIFFFFDQMAAHLKMGRFSPRILMKTIFFVCFFFSHHRSAHGPKVKASFVELAPARSPR